MSRSALDAAPVIRPRRASPRGSGRETKQARSRRAAIVAARLATAYPDVQCPLAHRNTFELLVAVILSAQCTDQAVNKVTPELFRRWPTLIGFSIQDDESGGEELQVTVAMYPEPQNEERGVLLGEIAEALAELVDAAPGAGPLLRARTFARTLH